MVYRILFLVSMILPSFGVAGCVYLIESFLGFRHIPSALCWMLGIAVSVVILVAVGVTAAVRWHHRRENEKPRESGRFGKKWRSCLAVFVFGVWCALAFLILGGIRYGCAL